MLDRVSVFFSKISLHPFFHPPFKHQEGEQQFSVVGFFTQMFVCELGDEIGVKETFAFYFFGVQGIQHFLF